MPDNNSEHKTIVERISRYLDNAFPLFFFFLAISFYLRTYDSAMVKITEVQMFGTILVALWLCKVFESGHWPFNKNQTLIIAPFIAIFVSGVFSFYHSPLHWGSFDFFVRRVIFIGFAMSMVLGQVPIGPTIGRDRYPNRRGDQLIPFIRFRSCHHAERNFTGIQ